MKKGANSRPRRWRGPKEMKEEVSPKNPKKPRISHKPPGPPKTQRKNPKTQKNMHRQDYRTGDPQGENASSERRKKKRSLSFSFSPTAAPILPPLHRVLRLRKIGGGFGAGGARILGVRHGAGGEVRDRRTVARQRPDCWRAKCGRAVSVYERRLFREEGIHVHGLEVGRKCLPDRLGGRVSNLPRDGGDAARGVSGDW